MLQTKKIWLLKRNNNRYELDDGDSIIIAPHYCTDLITLKLYLTRKISEIDSSVEVKVLDTDYGKFIIT